MGWYIGTPYPTSIEPRTLADLPPAGGLRTGTSFAVTDYGGNIATAVGGQWRFEFPFRTTWANRPPVGLVPAGTELQATDYNNQTWVCDGTYWRPAQGRVLLYSKFGLASSPVAVIKNSTGAAFTLPGGAPKIPASMIVPNSKVYVQADSRKVGGNAAANAYIRLGSAGSISDPAIVGLNIPLTTNSDICLTAAARFGASKTSFVSRNYLGDGVSSTGNVGVALDREVQVNTDADMFFTLDITGASPLDTFNLIGCIMSLEA